MGREENIRQWRHLASEVLQREIAPHLAGEKKIWELTYGSAVTQSETLNEVFKSRIPIGKGTFRVDRRVFHEFPTDRGTLYVVQNYSGGTPLPQDFMLILPDLQIPHSAALYPGGLFNKWKNDPNQGKKQSVPFCTYLDEIKDEGFLGEPKFAAKSEFTVHLGPRISIQVPYTLQLVSMSDKRVLFMYKTIMRRNLMNNKPESSLVDEFLELADLMRDSIIRYGYDGPAGETSILLPDFCLEAIPEFAQYIPDKGTPSGDTSWELPTNNRTHKKSVYCSECGKPNAVGSKFCAHCGNALNQ